MYNEHTKIYTIDRDILILNHLKSVKKIQQLSWTKIIGIVCLCVYACMRTKECPNSNRCRKTSYLRNQAFLEDLKCYN